MERIEWTGKCHTINGIISRRVQIWLFRCKDCGHERESYSHKLTCKCKDKRANNGKKALEKLKITCANPECGIVFTPKNKNQKYCGQKCVRDSAYLRKLNGKAYKGNWKDMDNQLRSTDFTVKEKTFVDFLNINEENKQKYASPTEERILKKLAQWRADKKI